jgi:hypothetical protein
MVSNFLKGKMVRINPKNGKIERFIDFGVLGVLDPRGCAVGGYRTLFCKAGTRGVHGEVGSRGWE